jgi:hypothetical protein
MNEDKKLMDKVKHRMKNKKKLSSLFINEKKKRLRSCKVILKRRKGIGSCAEKDVKPWIFEQLSPSFGYFRKKV